MTRVQTWVKFQKLCHYPSPFPPGKGGKPYGKKKKKKKVQISRLKYGTA